MAFQIIVCRVGQPAETRMVEDPWNHAKVVTKDAYIEIAVLEDGITLMLDEEGLLKGLPLNREIPARAPEIPKGFNFVARPADAAEPGKMGVHRIHGDFIVAKHDYKNDVPLSLSDDEVRKYMEILK